MTDGMRGYRAIGLLGLGTLGINLLWPVYNAYVPIFLQAGRADFDRAAGVSGFALGIGMSNFIMTLDNLAALLILPYVGALSDRTRTRLGRRRPFVLAGAPIAAAAFALLPYLAGGPLVFFMGAVMLTLLGMDLFRTPLAALLADLAPQSRRSQANGLVNLLAGLGAALGLLAGAFLFAVSPAAPFVFAAAGMLVTSLLVVASIREPETAAAHDPETPGLRESLRALAGGRDPSVLRLLLAVFFWFLGFSAIEANFTAFAVNAFHIDGGKAAGLLAFFALAVLVGSIPAGLLGALLGRRTCIRVGIVLFGVFISLGYGIETQGLLRVALLLAGLSWSLIGVNALPLVLDFAPPERDGAYTGLYFLAYSCAAVVGPVLTGQALTLAGNNYRLIFLYAPAMVAVAFALMGGVHRPESGRLERV